MRLGILVSHPIQYYSPWFRALAQRLDLEVFYAYKGSPGQQADAGFGVPFEWDIDLLSGYSHSFLHNVSRKPGTNSYDGCDTPEIGGIIQALGFDAFIVCGWYLKSYWQAVRACRRNDVPVFARGDSQLNTERSLLKRAVKQVTHRKSLRHFDGFLSVGRRNREYLLHYGVPADRIFFVPHFVDNEWFAARAETERRGRQQTREGWEATDSTFVVLFVGKFISEKRPADLLEAVGLIAKDDTDIVAVFVGAGELEPELRRLASRLAVRARFEGFHNQTELPRFYAGADCLVLPSGSETWGLVVNEGMACGLPAIVSDAVGCSPDLIEEGRTGFSFSVGDVKALAHKLRLAVSLRNSGFDFAPFLDEKLRLYSIDAAVNGTLDAIEEIGRRFPRQHPH